MQGSIDKLHVFFAKVVGQEAISREELPGGMGQEEMITTRLLLLLRNNQLPASARHKLLILEELTSVVSERVGFNYPIDSLGSLDRLQFQEQCRTLTRASLKKMGERVYGIYPGKDLSKQPYNHSILLSLERVNNHANYVEEDWRTTRKTLKSIHQKGTPEQKQIIEMLLCDKEGLTHRSRGSPWRELWTQLYFWTIDLLLENRCDDILKKQTILSVVQKILGNYSIEESVICDLIMAAINMVVGEEADSYGILRATEAYLQTERRRQISRENFELKIQQVLLLRDFLTNNQLIIQAEWCDARLKVIREVISKDLGIQSKDEQMTLISYLLPRSDLESFLNTNFLPFWNYALQEKTKNQLALNFLQGKPSRNIEWKRVIMALHPQNLRVRILEQPEVWPHQLWATSFLQLCQEQPQEFVELVRKAIGDRDSSTIPNDLRIFYDHWDQYLKLKHGGSKLNGLKKLICFDFRMGLNFKKCSKFPQQISQVFQELCMSHIRQLKRQKVRDLQFAFSPAFVSNLQTFSASKWDERWDKYWYEWTDLLLNDDQFMRGIIEINPCLVEEQGRRQAIDADSDDEDQSVIRI